METQIFIKQPVQSKHKDVFKALHHLPFEREPITVSSHMVSNREYKDYVYGKC